MNIDEHFMREAIRLALRARGATSPNPLVGALLVKQGKIVGRGYHHRAGEAHAEVNALRDAGARARGSTLYVSLEPCDHYGRTPPCTDALIAAGIRRTVIALKDPNPINNGRGMKHLVRAGIRVTCGLLSGEAVAINKTYLKWATTKLPYITVKVAQSLDGKIAAHTGDSRWISAPASQQYVHRLRRSVDAVMVGARTVVKDNPRLTNRSGRGKQPIRIIVDGALATPVHSRIFATTHLSPVIVATARRSTQAAPYERRGAEVMAAPSRHGMIDLRALLQKLAARGITHILVEGGGTLIGKLYEAGLIDEWLFFVAPMIIGGRDAITAVEGTGVARIRHAATLHNVIVTRIGRDILIRGESC